MPLSTGPKQILKCCNRALQPRMQCHLIQAAQLYTYMSHTSFDQRRRSDLVSVRIAVLAGAGNSDIAGAGTDTVAGAQTRPADSPVMCLYLSTF